MSIIKRHYCLLQDSESMKFIKLYLQSGIRTLKILLINIERLILRLIFLKKI